MLQIVLDNIGCGNTHTPTLIGAIGRTDGDRIAVANHMIGLFQVQFLAILTIERKFFDFLRGRVDYNVAGHTAHIGSAACRCHSRR